MIVRCAREWRRRCDLSHIFSTERNESLARAYLQAQLAADGRSALALITDRGLAIGVPVVDIYVEVIQWAQREIGKLWQQGAISIAQEHIASAITQTVLPHLYAALPRPEANGRHVLVACVEGERHDLGARVVADLHEAHGYDVRFLGADVPLDQLIGELERSPADLVALSCVSAGSLPSLRAAAAGVRQRFGRNVRIVAGGQAVGALDSSDHHFDLAVAAGTARDALQLSEQLFVSDPNDSGSVGGGDAGAARRVGGRQSE